MDSLALRLQFSQTFGSAQLSILWRFVFNFLKPSVRLSFPPPCFVPWSVRWQLLFLRFIGAHNGDIEWILWRFVFNFLKRSVRLSFPPPLFVPWSVRWQ